jgi:N-acetyl-gamma-glutamyl-phosphate reductase
MPLKLSNGAFGKDHLNRSCTPSSGLHTRRPPEMFSPVKIAVLGASGYSGIELLRLLLRHPHAELVAVTSRTLAGKALSAEFPRFRGVGVADKLTFTNPEVSALKDTGAEIAFLALPHGVSVEFAKPLLEAGMKVIDLSADFRLRSAAVYKEFYAHDHAAPELLDEAVYALPEVRPEAIRQARLIACPGCYPTSILLPLIPLLKAGLISADPIAVSSMSGASGAGRNASIPLLFCEVQNSLRSYSVPSHRHLSEITQELAIAAGREVPLSFVPHLVPTHSGICSTIFATPVAGVTLDQISAALNTAYADQPFIRLLGANQSPDTKNVVGTNFVDLGWALDQRAGRLILMSTEDNIGKGASGQAVQNMNLICGFEPTAGLLNI